MATRRGDIAKQHATDVILKAFEGSFVQDKKIYISVNDGGETVQLALSITMPKVAVAQGPAATSVSGNEAPWESAPQTGTAASTTPVATQLSEDDRAKVAALMQQLGLE